MTARIVALVLGPRSGEQRGLQNRAREGRHLGGPLLFALSVLLPPLLASLPAWWAAGVMTQIAEVWP